MSRARMPISRLVPSEPQAITSEFGALESGQLQQALLAGIALQHRDMAALAGRGIGRIGIQRDRHHRLPGIAEAFHDLPAGIAQAADDGVVLQPLRQQHPGVAAHILQHHLEHADKGQRRHDDLGEEQRPMAAPGSSGKAAAGLDQRQRMGDGG